ncbi:hypothetical protein LSAT2_024621 [Lamellibrachia satsuma]|nr:hypothetical protein LSAT2_024621 [Lamellibrachia satsuma]
MPLRYLLRFFARDERLVEKLAESLPMRRAAQWTAFAYHKSRQIGHEVVEKLQSSDQVHQLKGEAQQFGKKAQSFQNTLTEEMKKAYEELQKMKNKK